jgi:hypothetical protein
MPSRCYEFVDSRLRRSPPDRASVVPYGQAGENAMRFPHLAHRSAAAHKLHSTPQQGRMNLISGRVKPAAGYRGPLAYSSPGSCPNNRNRCTEPLPAPPGTGIGRPPKLLRRDEQHQPISVKALALSLSTEAWQTITWREGTADWLSSRFARQSEAGTSRYLADRRHCVHDRMGRACATSPRSSRSAFRAAATPPSSVRCWSARLMSSRPLRMPPPSCTWLR